MKRNALISAMLFVSVLFISHGLYAQRYYRYDPGIQDDYYDLNLTREQMEKIEMLELDLEKELSPLVAKLRSSYVVLDELEAQRSPDPKRIENAWEVIYRLEEDIQNKEILHEKKVRDLLTEDQKAIFDSYYAYSTNPYGRGGLGRGYFGPGFRGFRSGNYGYGYGGYGYGAGIGRNYLGRGAGMLGRGYYGYGRGIARGYGVNRGNFGRGVGRGAGQLGYGRGRFFRGVRYGRGPCGAGLGRWYRWNDNNTWRNRIK